MDSTQVRFLLVAILTIGVGCGGDGGGGIVDPGDDDDPAVATVTVSAPPGDIVAGQTKQLTVVLKDASGAELTGRTVTFSTSSTGVAQVSDTGLVTAVGPGQATITATSESKTGTVAVRVVEGTLIGPAGATLTAPGGAVQLVVPAGAVATETVIAFSLGGNLPNDPSQVAGSRVLITPTNTMFAAPVQLRIPYNPTGGPSGVEEATFRLHRVQGSSLVSLGGTVDVAANAVSAEITQLGTFAVGRAPAATPCTDPEFRQFDFWVGLWSVTTPAGGPPVPSDITAEPSGCAVFENFANGSGRSINVFNPADGRWHQTFWFTTGIQPRVVLIGGLVGDEMILESPNPPGSPGSFNRWTWTQNPNGTVRQLQEQSTDGGATVGGFDGLYTPR